MAGGASTSVAVTSTVTVDWEVAGEVDVAGLDVGAVGKRGEVAGPDAEGVGQGEGDPGEKAALLNGLFWRICPVRVL